MKALNTIAASELAVELSSRAIDANSVVHACLERIDQREDLVGAWEYVDPEQALTHARDLDRGPVSGPLHGIPVGIKDVIDTYDMPTSYGSSIYRGHRPARDAACVAAI